MTSNLTAAIDELYEAFSRHDCRRLENVQDDCARDSMAEELTERLCGKELRSLSASDLLDYYYLAVDHIGTPEDLRHFLPRILELIASDPSGYLAPAHLPSLLARARPPELTPAEKEALGGFLEEIMGSLPREMVEESRIVLGADK